LYADTVTGSMERAMAETGRRRAKQLEHNRVHGIEPRTIRKQVRDVMEGARADGPKRGRRRAAPATAPEAIAMGDPAAVAAQVARLEAAMYEHARNLEFEEAARLRDQVATLRQAGLGLPARRAG
jgi:excinuclease ABC subunit B